MKEDGKAGSGEEKSNPANLRAVFGDEQTRILRIRGDREKSHLVSMVGIAAAYPLLPLRKGDLSLVVSDFAG